MVVGGRSVEPPRSHKNQRAYVTDPPNELTILITSEDAGSSSLARTIEMVIGLSSSSTTTEHPTNFASIETAALHSSPQTLSLPSRTVAETRSRSKILVVTKMFSRAMFPAADPSCNALPTSRSFRYRSAQSKWRNPASSASRVAVMVSAGSGIKVPKPSAGMRPAPWWSGIVVIRRSAGSGMSTPPHRPSRAT